MWAKLFGVPSTATIWKQALLSNEKSAESQYTRTLLNMAIQVKCVCFLLNLHFEVTFLDKDLPTGLSDSMCLLSLSIGVCVRAWVRETEWEPRPLILQQDLRHCTLKGRHYALTCFSRQYKQNLLELVANRKRRFWHLISYLNISISRSLIMQVQTQ